MTLEAALVLPLFLFFFMNLLFVMDMVRLQSNMLAALQQTGQQVAEYAYYYRYGLEDLLGSGTAGTQSEAPGTELSGTQPERMGADTAGERSERAVTELPGAQMNHSVTDVARAQPERAVTELLETQQEAAGTEVSGTQENGIPEEFLHAGISFLLSETFVRSQVRDFLGPEYLNHTCLSGGEKAISYLRSSILAGDDIVDLVADYRVRPFIRILGLGDFALQSRYYAHAWVGYELTDEQGDGEAAEEEYVYLTETGTVYHVDRNCTYLRPRVQRTDAAAVDQLRNHSGGKYYPCENCRPAKVGVLFVTPDGNRYHDSTECSGLKRTVREVPRAQVEGRMPPCSKCGGE